MIRTHRSELMKSPSSSPNKPGAADPKFLKIVYRLIRELKTNPINPRLHSQKQIRQIANSIRIFGFNVPILIDRRRQRDRGSRSAARLPLSSAGPRCRRCASIT